MAEPHVLISRDKYQQLLPNNPPPSQLFDVKTPPPGLPKNDEIVADAKIIQVDDNKRKGSFIYDDPVFSESSDDSEDSDDEKTGQKQDIEWNKIWQTI